MAIDYNQDIAPLRQEYFPMLTGDTGFNQAMDYRQKVLTPMRQQTMKMEQHAMSMQRQDLAYETQKFTLAQSRQKAKSQLDFMEKLPDLMSQLDAITNDPEKDSYTATKDLLGLQMQYAPSMQHNPLIGTLFTSANSALNVDRIRQEKEEREAEKAESRKFGLMTMAAQQGATDLTRKLAGPEVDDAEQAYIGLSGVFKDAKDTKTKAAYDKLRAETEAAAIGKVDDRYKEFESTLRSMTTKSTQNQWENMTAPKAGGDIQQIVNKVSEGFDIGKANKIRLQELYVDVMARSGIQVDKEALKDANVEDLFRSTYSKVLEQRRILGQYGQPEKASTINTGFNT
jgi:hypothetical protein|tara:strand:+ start:2097 stop:3122 length:1026 start_codon:yes stop_codon:yes gene_type:complete